MPNGNQFMPILVGGPGFIQEALPSGRVIIGPSATFGPSPYIPIAMGGEQVGQYLPVPLGGTGGTGPIQLAAAGLSGFVEGGLAGAALGVLGGLLGGGLANGNGGNGMTTGLQEYGINGGLIGTPEPAPGTVKRQWSVAVNSNTYGTFRIFFYQMFDGYTLCYNPSTKSWKRWRPKKPISFTTGNLSLSKAVKIQGILDKLWRTAAKKTKAIKLSQYK